MAKCRGCDAEIIWIQTARGKNLPVDKKPVKGYIKALEVYELRDVHIPHWSMCPDAAIFKKSNEWGEEIIFFTVRILEMD